MKFLGYFEELGKVYIVLEYAKHGNLFYYLSDDQSASGKAFIAYGWKKAEKCFRKGRTWTDEGIRGWPVADPAIIYFFGQHKSRNICEIRH